MTISHHITPTPELPAGPGLPMLNQLGGLIGQAQALISGGVGLPGVQSIGTQIANMAGQITSAGTQAGIDISQLSSTMSSLGTSLSGITSLSGASGIMSGLTSGLSALTTMLNPAGGGLAQIIHSHILDMASGITHSAFSGQHLVQLLSGGLNLQSIAKIAKTAPAILHNGNTLMSDALNVSKGITGMSFSMLSDRKLKSEIEDHEPVLEQVLQLRVKRFLVAMFNHDSGEILEDKVRSRGLIAQELQEHFPELVHENAAGFLQIDVDGLVFMLLSGFIDHVEETRRDIADLRAQIVELKR